MFWFATDVQLGAAEWDEPALSVVAFLFLVVIVEGVAIATSGKRSTT